MTDTPNDETAQDDTSGRTPDGWAAWDTKDDAPVKPLSDGKKLDPPQTGEPSND